MGDENKDTRQNVRLGRLEERVKNIEKGQEDNGKSIQRVEGKIDKIFLAVMAAAGGIIVNLIVVFFNNL